MIHAICLKCGAGKVGAMTQCPRCAFVPAKTEDKAKSILLSDRCARMAMLEKVAEKIARGEKLKFDESDVHKWCDALETASKPVKKVAGLTTKQWTFLAWAIGAGIAFGFCLAGMMLLR
jgi:hypothetical protein